ncbi:MAG: glutamine synthetase beta-grasp domain-containing protein, partial [Thermomicrobium sp.]|nr:glutamine synthetase beta-grasp domain-containing protein [Thermomicrobium sp.]
MYGSCTTPEQVLDLIRKHDIRIVDLRFTDIPGTWQHASLPASQLSLADFERGIGFDGSSIRGFQAIEESDMLLMPDPTTAFVDPFATIPTLVLICNVFDPETRRPYSRDPRYVAQKAEEFLRATGIADTSYWGPEIEFFLFDHVSYDVLPYRMGYTIDSREGYWNSGRNDGRPNLGYTIRPKEGYFPAPPHDTFQDIRSEAALILEQIGVPVEMHHHEVATAGQGEIDMRRDTLTAMADKVMIYKYVVKNVARKHGVTATFMPKPLFGDNGNGMHTHQS